MRNDVEAVNRTDVPDEYCFKSVKMFERTGLFDYSCSNWINPLGENSEFALGVLVSHYNRASTGECSAVTEFGEPAFSVITKCSANGATIKKYNN